jgi:glycerol-3-phosphate dehydrogenase (NAD(P)+)
VLPFTWLDLKQALSGADLVVLGVNSLGVNWAAGMLGPVLPENIPVLMLTKGLAGIQNKLQILPDLLRSGMPADIRDRVEIYAVGGPSIAGELANRRHTSVMVAGQNLVLLRKLRDLLSTEYYHVWLSTDIIGVEMCVALKNAYALAVGIIGGILEKEGKAENGAVMHNMAAAIFAQGLWETAYLVEHMGGELVSVYSLPGAGDLYVTSAGGRNSRMGQFLGLGLQYTEAKAKYMPDETVEGAQLLLDIGPTIESMVDLGILDRDRIPLLRALGEIVCQEKPVNFPWDQFFAGVPQ